VRSLTPRPGSAEPPRQSAPAAAPEAARPQAAPPWRLPPGAELWRPSGPAMRSPALRSDEAPAPVWRSSRPLRRRQGAGLAPAPEAPAPGAASSPEAAAPHGLEAAVPPGPQRRVGAGQPRADRSAEWGGLRAPGEAELATGLRAPARPAAPLAAPLAERVPGAPAEAEAEAPMVVAEPPAPGLRLRLRRLRRAPSRPRDPAPSRMAYRLHRLWLTPLVRGVVRVGGPVALVVLAVAGLLSDADRRAALAGVWTELRSGIEERPEFQVSGVDILGASAPVRAALAALAPQEFPVSSFRLDLDGLRAEVEALDAVARAELRVRADAVLELRIEERVPVAIWRTDDGLKLIDAEGRRVARLLAREARADLPLLAGLGADAEVAEARALAAAAAPLGDEVVGFVRMGERRWDVVLSGDRRILLPGQGALSALERVLALDQAQDLLARDVAVVDMRLPGRPTVRLSGAAVEELRRVRATAPAGRSGGPTR